LGNATFEFPTGPIQITMDGKQAVQLSREIGADIMVPMHFESWGHFKEGRAELVEVFTQEGFLDKVCWTAPGVPKVVF
jgi:L-ascorbate metabolism protein UlaG (beta-lactamase superfamily)